MRRPALHLAFAALLTFSALGLSACGDDDDDNGVTNPPPTLELNSGPLVPNQSYQHTFASAGTFPYHCTLHPSMVGTVTVNAGSANDSVLVSIINSTASGFSPGAVTVKPGGYVRWVNVHTVTHNVTSN